jgi:serine/threonine protein kinase
MIAAQHENVVVVYSAELEGGEPVIRMEYLPTGSVTDKYGGNPIAVADAVRMMEDACRGVEHLHVRGILHRDINTGQPPAYADWCRKSKRFRPLMSDRRHQHGTPDLV